jgi:hypothetical protein
MDLGSLDLSTAVTVHVEGYNLVVAMYYSIDGSGSRVVPTFSQSNDTSKDLQFHLTEDDCPDVDTSYLLTVSAWNQSGDCDLASCIFQRSAFGTPSGADRKEAAAGKNRKPAVNVGLSDTLPTVTKADNFWVVGIPGNPSTSTKFYGHWFRRDKKTGAIVRDYAWYQKNAKTGNDEPPHLMALSGQIALPMDEDQDRAGTYTVVVLAGTPVEAPHQPHKFRIAHAFHSVSFTYDGKS